MAFARSWVSSSFDSFDSLDISSSRSVDSVSRTSNLELYSICISIGYVSRYTLVMSLELLECTMLSSI